MEDICANIIKYEHSWPFREPVNPEEVPDYHTVIKDPMDLSTIQKRLASKFYKTKEIFWADITLMCDNCRRYNPKDSIYYEMAQNCQRFADQEFRVKGLLWS